MAGVPKTRKGNEDVYEAVAVVREGRFVIPAAGATNPGVQGITEAGDAAINSVGISSRRAEPLANQNLTSTDADGYPAVYPNPVNELVTCYKEAVIKVTYTAAAVGFGTKLCVAAGGTVRAWVTGVDPVTSIIGECRVVGGISAAGGVGFALVY